MATRDDVELLKTLFGSAAAEGIRRAQDVADSVRFGTFALHDRGSAQAAAIQATVNEDEMRRRYQEHLERITTSMAVPHALLVPPPQTGQLIIEPTPQPTHGPSIYERILEQSRSDPEWQRQMIYGQWAPPEESAEERAQRLEHQNETLRQMLERASRTNPYDRTQPLSEARLRAYEALRSAGAVDNDETRFLAAMMDDEPADEPSSRPPAPARREPEPERKVQDFRPGRVLEL